jgi:RHS repeat-associated protein
LIRERIASGETAQTNSYVYGLDLSGGLQGAGTIGGILATVREGDSALVVGFYAYDANGNVTDLVGTNGTGLARYEYDPFGNPLVATGALAAANPFRFSTKYTDDETGLVYYGYRYYNPELGRWTSRDPIEEQGGVNLYVMCSNDILQGTDLLGLCDAYDETDKRCSTDRAIAFLPGLSNKALVIRYSFIFRSACQEHDRCYATCGKSKRECDDVFGREMDDICRKRYPRPFIHAAHRVECLAMSKTFLGAVRLFGDTPAAGSQRFSKLQEMAREKCCCDQSSDHVME